MKPAIPLRNAVLVSGCLLGFRCAQGDDWKPVIRRNGVTDPYDAGWQLSSNCIESGSGRETINGKTWADRQLADRGEKLACSSSP